jgi:hypothetical protein
MGLVLAGGLLASRSASATTNYVCEAWRFPSGYNTGQGSYGAVVASFYSGPSCTGSVVSMLWFCSTNATSSVCALPATCGGAGALYTEEELNTLIQMLRSAAAGNQKVEEDKCGSQSGEVVYFRAD